MAPGRLIPSDLASAYGVAIMQLTEEQHTEICQVVADFRRGMEIRNNLNLRVARRVTLILRTGIISLGAITVILLVMLVAFNMKLVEMSAVLETMNQKFSSMSANMGKMQVVLKAMDKNVAYLPSIVEETGKMRGVVETLSGDIHTMSGQVSHLQSNITGITGNLDQMTRTFRVLDVTVHDMSVDIDKISKPSRFFNNMMPFLP
jgi:methyl-accepting chemotaxis protein